MSRRVGQRLGPIEGPTGHRFQLAVHVIQRIDLDVQLYRQSVQLTEMRFACIDTVRISPLMASFVMAESSYRESGMVPQSADGRSNANSRGAAKVRQGRVAYAGLALSVFLLGVNWPVMKFGLQYIPAFWMVSLRLLFTLPLIGLFVLIWHRRAPVLTRADVPVILGVALFQNIGMLGLITLALRFVPAGTASILIYTTPLWMLLLDWSLFGMRPTGRRVVLTLLSAAGCLTILFASGQPGVWLPLLGILLASACWAASMRLISRHAWVGTAEDALFWQSALAGIVMAVVAWAVDGPLRTAYFEFPAIACLAYTGFLASGLGFGLMMAVGRILPAPRIALISTATPLVGFLSANLLLGEPILPLVVLGASLMLSALALGTLPEKR